MATVWEAHHGKELDDITLLEERELAEVQWSDLSLPLSKFVDEYTLPQIVQIADGFCSEEDESSLSSGQIMKVHCFKTISNVRGVDQQGHTVFVPLNTRQKIRVRPTNHGNIYDSVSDLIRAKPFPKFVEVVRGYYDPTGSGAKTGQDLTIEAGEILEVIRTSENPLLNMLNKERNTVFKNMKGVEIRLPHDCQPGFKILLGKDACFLVEAVNQNALPFCGSFVASNAQVDRQGDKQYTKHGVIRFEEVHRKEFIIASCGLHSVRVVFTIPKDIEVSVRIAEGTLKMDPGYSGLCQGYNNYKNIDELVLRRYELDIHRNVYEVNGYEYHIRSVSEGEFVGLPPENGQEDNNSDEHEYDYIDHQNNTDKLTTSLESQIQSIDKEPTTGSYNLSFGESGYLQKDESVTLVGIKSLASSTERLHQIACDKVSSQSVTESQDTDQQETQRQDHDISKQQENIPPASVTSKPHATESRTGACAPPSSMHDQSKNAELNCKDTTTVSPTQADVVPRPSDFKIPTDLSTLDTNGVCSCLKVLNLRHLVEIFQENQINGSLLVSLSEEDLSDLTSKRFERKKLLKFIEGWRPDV